MSVNSTHTLTATADEEPVASKEMVDMPIEPARKDQSPQIVKRSREATDTSTERAKDRERAPKKARIGGDDSRDPSRDRSTSRGEHRRESRHRSRHRRDSDASSGRWSRARRRSWSRSDRSYSRSRSRSRSPIRHRSRSRSRSRSWTLRDRGRRDWSRRDWDRRDYREREPYRRPSVPEREAPRRKVGVSQEERKRGQRLFGGLLGTLSSQPGRAARPRPEKKPAKAEPDRPQQSAQDAAELERTRKLEQIAFEEKTMDARHANLLALARNLQTHSEPRVYYLPWELSHEQEQTIDKQVQVAEATIAREKDAFARQKQARLVALGAAAGTTAEARPGQTVADQARDDDANETAKEAGDQPAGEGEGQAREAGKTEGQVQTGHDQLVQDQQDLNQQDQQDLNQQDQQDLNQQDQGQPAEQAGHDTSLEHREDHRHRHEHDEKDVMVETEEDTVLY